MWSVNRVFLFDTVNGSVKRLTKRMTSASLDRSVLSTSFSPTLLFLSIHLPLEGVYEQRQKRFVAHSLSLSRARALFLRVNYDRDSEYDGSKSLLFKTEQIARRPRAEKEQLRENRSISIVPIYPSRVRCDKPFAKLDTIFLSDYRYVSIYLPIYLLTYLPTYLPTNLPTYLPARLDSFSLNHGNPRSSKIVKRYQHERIKEDY